MSKESVSKLFIDFNTIEENASLNRNGVGLGLSICKQLIEQMGGSVRVESEVGEGTQFIISFRTTCKITQNFLQDNRLSEERKREAEEILSSEASNSPQNWQERSGILLSMHSSDDCPDNGLAGKEKPTILIANDNFFLLNAIEELNKPFF
jgi:hypothetical protein